MGTVDKSEQMITELWTRKTNLGVVGLTYQLLKKNRKYLFEN